MSLWLKPQPADRLNFQMPNPKFQIQTLDLELET